VELKFKEQCHYCSNFYSRVKEHYPQCKLFLPNHLNVNFIKDKKDTLKQQYLDLTSFNTSKIIEKYVNDLKDTERNFTIDNSFLYFPDFKIGEGSYGAVVFGIKLNNYTPVAVKVQKNNDKKDHLEI
jgi:hypothetical protein